MSLLSASVRHAAFVLLAALVFAGCDQSTLTGTEDTAPTAPKASTAPAGTAPATTSSLPDDFDEPIDGQYIVTLNGDLLDGSVAEAAQSLATQVGGTLGFTYDTALLGFSAQLPDGAAATLDALPLVASVEQDRTVYASDAQQDATWGLDRSDQRTTSYDQTYTFDYTGEGVTAYIVDTGINTSHDDFGSRASSGFDAIGDGQNGEDCNGHGTHVAGTTGGSAYGIAKGVDLVAVRVLGCDGSGSNSGVIAGVDYVAEDANGPSVANMSLGGGASDALDEAVANAVDQGVTFVVAAGNGDVLGNEADACNYSPARAPSAVTIGASDQDDDKASFSNYGSCVDLFAPGVDITSAWFDSDTATNTISGTSMAAPHVAGAAALVLENQPSADPQAVEAELLESATLNIVTDSRTEANHLLYSLYHDGTTGGNEDDGSGGDEDCEGLFCGGLL